MLTSRASRATTPSDIEVSSMWVLSFTGLRRSRAVYCFTPEAYCSLWIIWKFIRYPIGMGGEDFMSGV
jgi:hypothetical protein